MWNLYTVLVLIAMAIQINVQTRTLDAQTSGDICAFPSLFRYSNFAITQ